MSSDACTPPAGTAPGSWHWLEHPANGSRIVLQWCDGEYLQSDMPWQETLGYRYHSAVPKPEEVEALRKVVLTLWRAEDPGGIFPAMKAAGLLDPTADYAQFSLTPLGRRALGVEG